MKYFFKLTASCIVALGLFLLSPVHSAPTKVPSATPAYSVEAIFLGNNQDDIAKDFNIKTTLGPIKITKFKGKISSVTGAIISADDIALAETLASISAKKNITANQGSIDFTANKTSMTSTQGSISCKRNITIGDDNCSLTAKSSIATTDGSITIDGSDCTIKSTNGKVAAQNNISITTNGVGSSITAGGNISCDLTISASATGSSIVSKGSIFAGASVGSGNKVIAWGSGSSIVAKDTIVADIVEAKTITCDLLVTHTRGRTYTGPIRTTRTNAGGTIIAKTIIANKVSATTVTTTKPSQTVSDSALALALSPVLNALFK